VLKRKENRNDENGYKKFRLLIFLTGFLCLTCCVIAIVDEDLADKSLGFIHTALILLVGFLVGKHAHEK